MKSIETKKLQVERTKKYNKWRKLALKSFARYMNEFIATHEITQSDFADMASISNSKNVSNWLNSRSWPNQPELINVLSAMIKCDNKDICPILKIQESFPDKDSL